MYKILNDGRGGREIGSARVEISVGDELSTCMWLKLALGTWTGDRDFAYPIWLEMKGMNLITVIKGEGK
ncbi:hypothetical protein OS493_037742 [Desmophyllum pertusum]|uniref:Uncharacterized protein n=1 Tax=Desmophyllum pertusum TaxID=174260 RepID=A0A9W9YKV3_9CNID|nr:hypothetical protein OS493_037742 [Desmophyllum pertusum]